MKNILIILFCLISLNIEAQNSQSVKEYNTPSIDTSKRIEVIAEYRQGNVYIRWAPNDPSSWYRHIISGYQVKRYEVDTDKGVPIMETVDSFIVKPWPKKQFKPYVKKNNESILVAAQCMYGEWEFEDSKSGFANRKDELNNRYGFALLSADINWEAALALGLAYVDDTTTPDKTYFYQVNPTVGNTQLQRGYTSLATIPQPVAIPHITTVLEHEKAITVQWAKTIHEAYYSGYYIEKSRDNKTFKRLNEKPFIGTASEEYPSEVFAFTDSVSNYQPHYYRVIGITAFGMNSPPSVAVRGMGKDKTAPKAPFNLKITCDPTSELVTLKWDKVIAQDLEHYAVYRSDKIDGAYQLLTDPLLSKDKTSFQEKSQNIRKFAYYKVSAIDTAENFAICRPKLAAFRDTISPDAPTGLTGTIDSSGRVVLRWNKNKELDLAGYHVYMTNSTEHLFTKINASSFDKTTWSDTITLKTFTESIYYKISAIDFHGHFSDFSKVVQIKRPDIIPPFPPSITSYHHEDGVITLTWRPSRSKDLAKHLMYKRGGSRKGWRKVSTFKDDEYIFKDKGLPLGKVFQYKIIAVDDDGLKSVDKAFVSVRTINKDLPKVPEITSCRYINNKSVVLKWNRTNDKKHKSYIIYRSINNGRMEVLGRENNKTSFTDVHALPNRVCHYAIKQSWTDGKKSKLSDPVLAQKQ